jgi:hypothetical protein
MKEGLEQWKRKKPTRWMPRRADKEGLTAVPRYVGIRFGATLTEPTLRSATRPKFLSSVQLVHEIHALRVRQAPLERAFWNLEQRIARLTDEIERRAAG